MSLIASVFVILGHRSYQRCSASTTEATDLMVFPQSNIDRRPSFVMPPGLSQAGKALDLYWARPVRKLVPPQTSEVVRCLKHPMFVADLRRQRRMCYNTSVSYQLDQQTTTNVIMNHPSRNNIFKFDMSRLGFDGSWLTLFKHVARADKALSRHARLKLRYL